MNRFALLPALALLLSACPVEEPPDEPGPTPTTRATLVGEMTWPVDSDADAEAAGAVDCAYTRAYDGVEDRSAPWLCGDCDVVYRADVTMTAGLDDCFSQVTTGDPAPMEHLGFGDGDYWRSSTGPCQRRS